ncbi:ParB N-terminal domain-containing protein [Oscillospiraceae bacterium 42-9]
MNIQKVPISKLNPAPYNPRQDLHPGDPVFEKLKHSMAEFGCVEPIVWNERTGNVVGGHQRLKVLIESGAVEADVSVVDLDPDQEKVLNLALNKITGSWDDTRLAELLQELEGSGGEILLSGFDEEEINGLLAGFDPDANLDDFFCDAPEKEKKPKMAVCPYCGKEHEV